LQHAELVVREPAGTPAPIPSARSPYVVYLLSLGSEESRRTMRSCLDRIAKITMGVPGIDFPWHQLTYEQTTAIRALLMAERDGQAWSPSHINKHLSALRRVLQEAWRLGLMTADDYQRAAGVPEVKGSREPAGRSIRSAEISAMLAACDASDDVLGIRDRALITMLQSTAARRAEAASALIERYDSSERALRVIGKGNKERIVYIHQDAVPSIDRWLVVVGERRGPILRPIDRWGHIAPRPMTPQSIGLAVQRRRAQAGLAPLTTHDFRRTFIGDFLDAGGDLAQAQQIAGHKLVTTTAGYDRRPGRKLRAAVDQMVLAR
jgi:site-specific recombinase XerD